MYNVFFGVIMPAVAVVIAIWILPVAAPFVSDNREAVSIVVVGIPSLVLLLVWWLRR